jgi:hypothetical protein
MSEPPSAAEPAREVAGRVRIWRDWLHLDGLPVGRVPGTDGEVAALRPRLAEHLYSRWFTQSWTPPNRARWAAPLAVRLHRAHAGARRPEPGWVALASGRHGVIATRSGAPALVATSDLRNLMRDAQRPVPGDSLAVIEPRDGVDESGAWWTAWSARPPAPLEVRLYWHYDPDHVEALVGAVTAALEDSGASYSMKCPSHEQLFGRVDAGVIYMSVAAWLHVKPALKRAHARGAAWLGDAVPPCTLRLGRGVAVAQDPQTGESFGQSRAGAVADGIIDAVAAGATSRQGLEASILAAMGHRGISLARPYRAEGRHADDAIWQW